MPLFRNRFCPPLFGLVVLWLSHAGLSHADAHSEWQIELLHRHAESAPSRPASQAPSIAAAAAEQTVQEMLDAAPPRIPLLPTARFDQINAVYLMGFNWELGNAQRDILTLEYFADTTWGDFFTFFDLVNLTSDDEGDPFQFYGEIIARFSFGKLLDRDFSVGPIKDVLTAHTLEVGDNPFGHPLRHLHGLGVDLDLPGFRHAEVNVYLRDDLELDGVTWQVTLAGLVPFEISGLQFQYGGYVDFAGREAESAFNINSGTRLLLDLGDALWDRPNEWFLGVEFAYWYNTFGIEGESEFVPQIALQYSF